MPSVPTTAAVRLSGAKTTLLASLIVRVTRPDNQVFHRIEIEGDLAHGCGARFELIDDLTFNVDTTAPVATLDAVSDCLCNGTSITGSAHDSDGDIRNWTLHRRQP